MNLKSSRSFPILGKYPLQNHCIRSYNCDAFKSPFHNISNPHWNTEAFIPSYNFQTRTVQKFNRANVPSEQCTDGAQFLKPSLVAAANSVIGVTAQVRQGWSHSAASSGTAFQVGPGVFLTHNHFPGRKKKGLFRGILPVNENGQIFKLSPMAIDARNKDAFEIDVISEPWVKCDDTGYTVMLKTLQQARMEGIWKPCLEYLYRWGNRLYCTDRGSETDMGIPLDVGVFTISSQTQRSLGRQRLFPSRKVQNIHLKDRLVTLGFPNAEPVKGTNVKSQSQLRSYLANSGGELRACVGSVKFGGVGTLFDEDRIEMIGVQNIVNGGSSGGPLISVDEPGSFLGIGNQRPDDLTVAVANEMHDEEARGATYITVDHPAVIATYLQSVVSRYAGHAFLVHVLMVDSLPSEILAYLESNKRFCQWYVEVAWQRLPQHLKTQELQRYWKRFGNLENPTYKKIAVPDAYDDWRGIRQVPLQKEALGREWTSVRQLLRTGRFGQLFLWLDILPQRLTLRNRKW